ncbi:MAG: TrkH family potassium uptake protein [Planctomycetota bacterium]|nr:TrkH family potassium uptake protein [Planctomycetota bacterium]MEC9234214.1 TrkH family potassium uptake protein [Planctomycetota bacterium]
MNLRLVARNLGQFIFILSVCMAVCSLISLVWVYRGEADEVWAFQALMGCSLVGAVASLLTILLTRSAPRYMHRREAVLLVSLSWVFGAFFAAFPYWIWSQIGDPQHLEPSLSSFTACFFEAMSGLTTTGATILDDIEAMPHGLLLWRATTQWLGGVGIVVLFVAVLPSLGVGGKRLFSAESTGPTPEGLRPHIRQTARILWLTYLLLSVAAFLTYLVGGMSPFEAVAQAMTTVSTAGFSTRNSSFASFDSAFLEYAACVFMFLGAISFGLYFRAIRKGWRALLHDTELKAFFLLMVFCVLVTTAALMGRDEPIRMVGFPEVPDQQPTFLNSLRLATFTVVSLQTTTGYCTADFDFFPELALCLLMMLAFIGGCAGSTAGGMKMVRALIGLKVLQSTIEREHRPSVVRPLQIGKATIDSGVKIEVLSVLLASLFFLALGTMLVQLIEGPSLDLTTALSETFSCLFNLGPGVASAGASETYSWMKPGTKWVLSSMMLLGRLEFFTVLVLFTRRYWKAE